MTRTQKLQTNAEVRDFVFMQLDHEFIRPGAESRPDEETWALTMASEDPKDGLWIVEIHHEGNGTFVGTIGFHYFDDAEGDHWIGLKVTEPHHGSEMVNLVNTANIMIHMGIIEQPSRELYRQVTEGTVPTADAGPSPYL